MTRKLIKNLLEKHTTPKYNAVAARNPTTDATTETHTEIATDKYPGMV
jgi:hypothetical protein